MSVMKQTKSRRQKQTRMESEMHYTEGQSGNHGGIKQKIKVAGETSTNEPPFSTENKMILDESVLRAKAALAMIASVTAKNKEVFMWLLGRMSSWISLRDRTMMESSGKAIKANAVVAQDGTGLSNSC
ncbi:Pectinesterase 3 [Capsicum chinense]|nr:Pectinesterase 3 [Capsicum chinense]